MIYVIKNNYNKKCYYRHTCDNCKSELVLEKSDMCKTFDTEIPFTAIKCPLCKKLSYQNEFVIISETDFIEYIKNEKSQ